MSTAVESLKEVKQHAESIKNDGDHRIEVIDIGDAWAQGDIAIVYEGTLPADCVVSTSPQRQLAPGTTQGSRHLLDSLSGITMYDRANATPLDGPVIEAKRRFSIDHPEHGNISLPAGVYSIRYQRAFADELRRIVD